MPSSRTASIKSGHSSHAAASSSSQATSMSDAPASLKESPESEPLPDDVVNQSESSKLKQLFGILKKSLGVKDLAAMRFSLPANLIEPMPNLSYWTYLDRPDIYLAMGQEGQDAVERMLAVVRFTFCMQTKFVHGRVVKPYNSVLGEHFRSHWDVSPATVKAGELEVHEFQYHEPFGGASGDGTASEDEEATGSDDEQFEEATESPLVDRMDAMKISKQSHQEADTKSLRSVKTPAGKIKHRPSFDNSYFEYIPVNPPKASASSQFQERDGAQESRSNKPNLHRIAFLNEQCSHHPPISTFWCESQPKGATDGVGKVLSYGNDHLSAKFTGTSVKVYAGNVNKGVFVKLPGYGEEYQITHPTALITGFLRGAPAILLADQTYITCTNESKSGKQLRTLLAYVDESWLGKAKYAVEGVIYECEEGREQYDKIKRVPDKDVLARIEGSWRGALRYKLTSSGDDWKMLIDVSKLPPLPKTVRSMNQQEPDESHRFWNEVTIALKAKDFTKGNSIKQRIEQAQRDKAAELEKQGKEHEPVFFEKDISSGKPVLSSAGRAAISIELREPV
ncbi:uncharacterized protein L969DRAFT_167801 [Mixia osmundae IAM 14324]|uniref:Oxysterol-binding protein n=1 Tax=Mixia osmundae (strain CBS 9802 / IAM 14324 / JCM 22182 / KY 12970) TaxID=764103 RepID=G7DT50_MIXOS|nr:uncharacterized protein L969DRAFT_167801 [Mixia osmundae IAM 14324]KEI42738.1 hypothetical protein L969DRAFT_167801 [Mixia osmundae IAM 14324]GAA93929.1 hypothetical protein E5Q_00575 [Mixia osmundae IAM 14324]